MKKGGGHIFQLSLICTLKAIEVIKKVKKRKKDWVTELWQINTLCAVGMNLILGSAEGEIVPDSPDVQRAALLLLTHLLCGPVIRLVGWSRLNISW